MTNEEAIKKLKAVQAEFNENWVDYGGINQAFEKAYQALDERPQSEWNYIQAGMCVCPFCGAMPHKLYKNYCAKCGAELKGGAENEHL